VTTWPTTLTPQSRVSDVALLPAITGTCCQTDEAKREQNMGGLRT
jgi:hypothetical protein